MNTPDHDDERYTSSESFNIKDLSHNSRVSDFVDRTHSLYTFYLIAGSCQVLLGLAIIVTSMLGLIEPRWVSTLLIMGASATTMIGLYLLYITVSHSQNHNSLLRSAMKRVMESRN